jgi:hypothetical protein
MTQGMNLYLKIVVPNFEPRLAWLRVQVLCDRFCETHCLNLELWMEPLEEDVSAGQLAGLELKFVRGLGGLC